MAATGCTRVACLNGSSCGDACQPGHAGALKDPCNHHPVRKRNGFHRSRKERPGFASAPKLLPIPAHDAILR